MPSHKLVLISWLKMGVVNHTLLEQACPIWPLCSIMTAIFKKQWMRQLYNKAHGVLMKQTVISWEQLLVAQRQQPWMTTTPLTPQSVCASHNPIDQLDYANTFSVTAIISPPPLFITLAASKLVILENNENFYSRLFSILWWKWRRNIGIDYFQKNLQKSFSYIEKL